MLCLTCGDEMHPTGAWCSRCGARVGYPNEGRGYLPQLESIRDGLAQGTLAPEDANRRLARLEEALGFMLTQVENACKLASQTLDEVQESTLVGFVTPLREGLQACLDKARELPCDEPWSEEDWEFLEQAQLEIMRGNQGMTFLHDQMARRS